MSRIPEIKAPVYVINPVLFVFSVLLLMVPAFINGYPLVYPDTGTYIYSGHAGFVPVDRPLFYGLFVRHAGLSHSLWLVVGWQAILVVSLFVITFRYLLKSGHSFLLTFISILILSLTTGIGVYTSQIMADIFTPAGLWSLALLPFISRRNWVLLAYLAGIIVVSAMVHLSNLVTFTFLSGLMILWIIMKRHYPFIIRKGPVILMLVFTVILSWFALMLVNYRYSGEFKISRTRHIFLMGRMIETGAAKVFLEDHCDGATYTLCQEKDSLPVLSWHFLWDEDSPLYKGGCCETASWAECWTGKDKEYGEVVNGILTDWTYCRIFLRAGISDFFRQLVDFGAPTLPSMMEGSPVKHLIEYHYDNEYDQYIHSRQAGTPVTFHILNLVQTLMIVITLVFATFFVVTPSYRSLIRSSILQPFSLIILAGLLVNAAACSSLAMVADRFQGRVVWLLPALMIFLIALYLNELRNK